MDKEIARYVNSCVAMKASANATVSIKHSSRIGIMHAESSGPDRPVPISKIYWTPERVKPSSAHEVKNIFEAEQLAKMWKPGTGMIMARRSRVFEDTPAEIVPPPQHISAISSAIGAMRDRSDIGPVGLRSKAVHLLKRGTRRAKMNHIGDRNADQVLAAARTDIPEHRLL
jgi:hypothetical protein